MDPGSHDSPAGPRRWIKFGCLGLVAALLIVTAWSAVLFGIAWQRTRAEDVGRGALTREVAPAMTGIPATADGPLRVELDFTVGEFEVKRGNPGEPIRVDAEYDQRSYALEESFEPGPHAAGTYRVRFREIRWLKDSGLRVLFGGHRPHVVVHLPPDVPIEFSGRFSKGGTEVDLGGLWLTDIDVDMEKGGMSIGVTEPLVQPVGSFRIRAHQGGFSAQRIGNASPRNLEIDAAMGGGTIDLRGEWLQDADVSVSHWMGGGNVVLPRNVDIEVEGNVGGVNVPTRFASDRDDEIPRPRLRLKVSSGLGSLKID